MRNLLCGAMLCSIRLAYTSTRNVFTTSRLLIDQRWRERAGLPKNPNSYGPLTDGPDYTYLDGRPTPIGTRLKSRLLKQRELAEKIIQYSKEVDFAVERHEQILAEKENSKKRILAGKLKPKGMPIKGNNPQKK
ncbi:large ribosomal subunit protein mL52 [Hetaerina americana]|uniref:large ribosomal subunit protein mL52 n=1 Tax=Hetaerina americana TaxID=62018 RepID=UPI003A7F1DCF